MRWPTWRRDRSARGAAGTVPVTGGAVPGDRPRRDWVALPRPRLAVDRPAPLTIVAGRRLPATSPERCPARIADARGVLRPALAGEPAGAPRGRVLGLASPSPPPVDRADVDTAVAHRAQHRVPDGAEKVTDHAVHTGAETPVALPVRLAGAAPPLTVAAETWVGPPREPAEPYRAPGWLRNAPQPGAPDPFLGLAVPVAESPTPAPAAGRPDGGAAPRSPKRLGLGAPLAPLPHGGPADRTPPPDTVEPAAPPAAVAIPVPARGSFVGTTGRPATVAPAPSLPAGPPVRPQPIPGPAVRGLAVPTPAVRGPAVPTSAVEGVPPDVATAVRAATGVDVGDVPVRRDSAVSRAVRRLRALAFSRRGEVYLPAEAGPLHRPETRALLAHELTHVAQHRTLGTALAREESTYGAVLERQARAVAARLSGFAGSVPETYTPDISLSDTDQQSADAPGEADLADVEPGAVQRAVVATHSPDPMLDPATYTRLYDGKADTWRDVGRQVRLGLRETLLSPSGVVTSDAKARETITGIPQAVREAETARVTAVPWRADQRVPAATELAASQAVSAPVPGVPNRSGPKRPILDSWPDLPPRPERREITDRYLDELNRARLSRGEAPKDQTTLDANDEAVIEELYEAWSAAVPSGPAGASTRQATSPDPMLDPATYRRLYEGNADTWEDVGRQVRLGLRETLLSPFGVVTSDAKARETITGIPQAARDEAETPARTRPVGPDGHPQTHDTGRPTNGRLVDPDTGAPIVGARDIDIDDLATAIYDRLRSRLRGELLVDRERAGQLADFG